MISVEEAISRILADITPLGTEKINILDALGRVIGENIFASRNIPPVDNSAMDGYALHWEDTRGAGPEKPVTLEIMEDIPAGTVPQKRVTLGNASRIMTGAPIPEGADAVVRKEDSEKENGKVTIYVEAIQGEHIRRAGEDVREGELVISHGDIMRPAEIGMLAALGRSFIACYQRPLVAILSTGDELVDVDEKPSPWKIVNSNSYSLAAQVVDSGAIPLQIGIAKDTRQDLMEKFRTAKRADIILSSGGVSVGDFDFVKDIMQEMGNHMQFWQVAMRPGKPLAYGTLGGAPLFGLPGNPVSAMVSFEQFVRPAILKMMGHRNLFRKAIKATVKENLSKKEGTRQFVRAHIQEEDGRYTAISTGEQGSGILQSMVRANGLIVLPDEVTTVAAGDEVTVLLLDNSLAQTSRPEYL